MGTEEKLWLGGALFDFECAVALMDIQNRNPGISDADALQELRDQLALAERLEYLATDDRTRLVGLE